MQGRARAAQTGETGVCAVLTHALLALFQEACGDLAALRRTLRSGTLTRILLQAQATEWLPTLISGVDESALLRVRPEVQARIIDIAVDAIESERLCPPIQLALQARALPPMPIHALVFSAFPHAANELYPLMVDAYVAGVERRERWQVVGVHERWLDGGRLRRALIFDEATQGMVEADILHAPPIRSAQVLALNLCEEHTAHQRIEATLFPVRLTNPVAGAARLDDKAWTGACWQRAGLPMPEFVQLTELPSTTVLSALGSPFIVKPVDGTEGHGVTIVTEETAMPVIADALLSGPVLASAMHGAIRYRTPDGPVRCTVRLNVCWDGHAAQVESGYAQVAADVDGIASAGRGGRLVPLPALWRNLCLVDGDAVAPAPADWSRLLDLAATGTRALAAELGDAMPGLVGIDLLLDGGPNGEIHPVLLEANGRPSGMGHSRFVTQAGPTDESGVTIHFWQLITEFWRYSCM